MEGKKGAMHPSFSSKRTSEWPSWGSRQVSCSETRQEFRRWEATKSLHDFRYDLDDGSQRNIGNDTAVALPSPMSKVIRRIKSPKMLTMLRDNS